MTGTREQADTSWMERAACLNEDPELFFLDLDDGIELRSQKTECARRICASCPVQVECLLFGLLDVPGDHWNIWGGTTGRQRSKIRRDIGWKSREAGVVPTGRRGE